MNSLFRFIEKYQFFLLFLVLEVFSFWLLGRHTYYQRSKFENVGRVIIGYTSSKINWASQYLELVQTNEILSRENIDLRNEIAKLSTKLDRLSTMIADTIVDPLYTFSKATIVNNSINKQYNYLTLNIGAKDGVNQEMGVITNNGVVGIVTGVSENYSTVISLLNIDLKISARLKRSNHFGSLYWDGRNYREVVLSDIPQHVVLTIGDTIVTSGYSAIFPTDLNLGVIKSFDSWGSNFHTIRVQLFNDFKQLHKVWVVANRQIDEREVLENTINEN